MPDIQYDRWQIAFRPIFRSPVTVSLDEFVSLDGPGPVRVTIEYQGEVLWTREYTVVEYLHGDPEQLQRDAMDVIGQLRQQDLNQFDWATYFDMEVTHERNNHNSSCDTPDS